MNAATCLFSDPMWWWVHAWAHFSSRMLPSIGVKMETQTTIFFWKTARNLGNAIISPSTSLFWLTTFSGNGWLHWVKTARRNGSARIFAGNLTRTGQSYHHGSKFHRPVRVESDGKGKPLVELISTPSKRKQGLAGGQALQQVLVLGIGCLPGVIKSNVIGWETLL